jgi:NADP-dependent 3-hydroxy acid dehydrogenase YdfG
MASPKAFNILPSDLTGPTDSITLITGGAAGIGLQSALLLHDISQTNKIVLLDRQKPNPEQAPEAFIKSTRVLALQCDLTDWNSQREAFEVAVQRFGKIDNVFVNAGIAEYKDQFFKDELDEQGKLKEPDRRVYDVDLAAANDTLKLAIHYLRKNNSGKAGGNIVLTASLAGYLASAGAPLYSAAKHGSLHRFSISISFCLLILFPSRRNLSVKRVASPFSLYLTRLCPLDYYHLTDAICSRNCRAHESSQKRHSNPQHFSFRRRSRDHTDRSCLWARRWRITLGLGEANAWPRCSYQQPRRSCGRRGVVDELRHGSQRERYARPSRQGC